MPLIASDESSNLSVPPLVPSAFDDEFEGFLLDAAWDAEGTLVTSPAPVVNASFSSGNARIAVGHRQSHLRLQNSGDGVERGISKLIDAGGLPTGFYWTRAVGGDNPTATNNNGEVRLTLCASVAGQQDTANRAQLLVREDAGGVSRIFCNVLGGGAGSFGGLVYDGEGKYWEYFGFLVTGVNAFTAYAAERNGVWQRMANVSYTGGSTIDRVALTQVNTTTTNGNTICLFDFFRYSAAVDLP